MRFQSLNCYLLGLGSMAIAPISATPAQSQEPALNFKLASAPTDQTNPVAHSEKSLENGFLEDQSDVKPLELPSRGHLVPIQAPVSEVSLPPPPLVSTKPGETTVSQSSQATIAPQLSSKPVELVFEPSDPEISHRASLPAESSVELNGADDLLDNLFVGESESLVAKAVGSAEGTRTPQGLRTRAYYGHVDPGNGVWNLGSFSYQHGASSPEEADRKQLRRLRSQAGTLQAKAIATGLDLSLEELLNGIDLANQAPLAALDRGGYIDWLHQAHQIGLQGAEAVLWARTRSFLDPDTRQWNAPGLGNNVQQISNDQERRFAAIAKAIEIHQNYQNSKPDSEITAYMAEHSSSAQPANSKASIVEQILNLDL